MGASNAKQDILEIKHAEYLERQKIIIQSLKDVQIIDDVISLILRYCKYFEQPISPSVARKNHKELFKQYMPEWDDALNKHKENFLYLNCLDMVHETLQHAFAVSLCTCPKRILTFNQSCTDLKNINIYLREMMYYNSACFVRMEKLYALRLMANILNEPFILYHPDAVDKFKHILILVPENYSSGTINIFLEIARYEYDKNKFDYTVITPSQIEITKDVKNLLDFFKELDIQNLDKYIQEAPKINTLCDGILDDTYKISRIVDQFGRIYVTYSSS